MERFHVLKDGQIIGSAATREQALLMIHMTQHSETHYMIRANFSIIYGEEEHIDYKMTAYGVRQAIWGSDRKEVYYFATKELREEYARDHDHFDRLRACQVDPAEVYFSYADYCSRIMHE
jgi:hypothetical protein